MWVVTVVMEDNVHANARAPCGHTFSLAMLFAVRDAEEQHFPLRALRTVAERANGTVRCAICGKPTPSSHVLDAASSSPIASLQVGCAPLLSDRPSGCDSLDLTEDGILMGDGVPPSLAAASHRCIEAALNDALARPSGEATDLFGEVREAVLRHDIKLDLTPSLQALMRDLVGAGSRIGGECCTCTCCLQAQPLNYTLSPSLTQAGRHLVSLCACDAEAICTAFGEDAPLVELSSIVSEDGANSQPAHCDTDQVGDESQRLLTAFVALHDIDADAGPTLVWPGTHTAYFHTRLSCQGPALLRGHRAYRLSLGQGGAALMDSRTWHCGGPNRSGRRRCLLVASFGSAGTALPTGSTYSLRSHLVGKHTLRSLRAGPAAWSASDDGRGTSAGPRPQVARARPDGQKPGVKRARSKRQSEE